MTRNNISDDTLLIDIIIENPGFLLFLEHFEVFPPLHEKTIADIATEKNVTPGLINAFAALYSSPLKEPDYTPDFRDVHPIVRLLRNSHRYYLNEAYPLLRKIIDELQGANDHSEIKMVDRFFSEYFDEVTEHLDYEDNIVFPYILDLHQKLIRKKRISGGHTYSVEEYREHHDDIEEKLADLQNLLIKYLPPENDHRIRRKLLVALAEFESDLRVHSLIEDIILIPLVETMEKLTAEPE